ncbi:SARP family transcriptional regulator [Actinomadura sp. NBRC 104425]|uniref:AfsR/SARP family transcriptional regulator n=1 Tax=Actinomadura sp. NBRC 104425 TaxID=3032204 RepID=UPI0024A2602B|nr:BTAD domain-containing putative transcriptional regulator [Actinomadura sp. NBRC 104425]GLZ13224.1 SARP family transcriptional regulator [Actinomadura sp. NBRC 104425]
MRIGILGPLEVVADGRPVEIGGARLRALLIRLALEAGRMVPADRLIDDLWEDDAPHGAPNALQSLVSRLRAAFQEAGAGRDRLESRRGAYRLAVPPEAVDAHDFEARVRRARGLADPSARSAGLRAALALWRGAALADASGLPFADGPAARLEELRRAALDERIDADLALGRHAELIPELQALATAEPLGEPLRGRLMRALYGAGRQAEALAEYESIRSLLGERLGVDPSPDLEAVYLAVLRRDSAALAPATPAAPRPAAATPPANGAVAEQPAEQPSGRVPGESPAPRDEAGPGPRGNLRAPLTSFIGRDHDLKAVEELLGDGRLVTLTGPGGSGKTRLAVEAGRRMLDRMPDGVWSVELAPIVDPAEVPSAVLGALGMRETQLIGAANRLLSEPGDALDRPVAALARKRLLLLLDNCEHVLDAAARLADRVLAHCPGVRVLATSREPLGITGETLWPVPPLEPPPADACAAEAMTYPAVRLLADRAAAVRPGFAVTDANAPHVTRICRALDGMPLAIELAAARLRAMTPGQLAARLDDRFRLLTGGSRTALPRHQTLRSVVEWSWELLSDAERALWRRLALFTGGATLDSAETVCAGDGLDRAEILDVLTGLVDKSLVSMVEQDGGEPRYGMLETVRAYGLERLAEAGEEDRLRRAHAEYFLRLAETAEPRLFRRDQLDWLARLAAEHDNTHAALHWAISAGEAALAVRFCAALGWYWFLRGNLREHADALEQVARLPDLPVDESTAVALAVGAMTSLDMMDNARVTELLLRARDICGQLRDKPSHPVLRLMLVTLELHLSGWNPDLFTTVEPLLDDPDPWVRGVARFSRVQMGLGFGLSEGLEEHVEKAIADFEAIGDRWGLSFALTTRAELQARRGRRRDAVATLERATRLSEALGGGTAMRLHATLALARQLFLLGDRARAEELLTAALRDTERMGVREGTGLVEQQLAELLRLAGETQEAARRLARAEELLGGHAYGSLRALVLIGRGFLDLAEGDAERARPRLEQAVRQGAEAYDLVSVSAALVGLAHVALVGGDPERAAVLIGSADALRGMPDLSFPEALAAERAARAALGDAAYTAAYRRGRGRTFDDVLEEFGIARPLAPGGVPTPPPGGRSGT